MRVFQIMFDSMYFKNVEFQNVEFATSVGLFDHGAKSHEGHEGNVLFRNSEIVSIVLKESE